MSKSVAFKVENLNQTVRDLVDIGVDVDDLKDSFSDLAQRGVVLAARFAPVRTGRLRGDIRGNRARNKAVITAGRKRIPYAGPINYGWRKRNIEPSLFMQKASNMLRPLAPRIIQGEINRLIRARNMD